MSEEKEVKELPAPLTSNLEDLFFTEASDNDPTIKVGEPKEPQK